MSIQLPSYKLEVLQSERESTMLQLNKIKKELALYSLIIVSFNAICLYAISTVSSSSKIENIIKITADIALSLFVICSLITLYSHKANTDSRIKALKKELEQYEEELRTVTNIYDTNPLLN
jgi:cell shape-determining protein MreC